jgi:UDP-glucose 4-epimerase
MTEPTSRRVLITGLATAAGADLAERLELDRGIEKIVGIDAVAPRRRFERTEFVTGPAEPDRLDAILRAARIDTVVETRPPSTRISFAATSALIAAVGAPGSPVRKLVFKSSAHYYGYRGGTPAFLTEQEPPAGDRPSGVAHDAVAAEQAVGRLSGQRPGLTVTILRFAEEIGPEARGPHMRLLGLPVIPSILGFDPRWQMVDQHDVVSALAHAIDRDLPGAYNVAADGVLALSEIAALLEKPVLPVLPPFGIAGAIGALRRAGLPAPLELVQALRLGRGLDNRRLKATGFPYRYTTREAVLRLRDHQRRRPAITMQGTLQER